MSETAERDGPTIDDRAPSAAAPRVYTIDPGRPFLPTLVDALFAGELVPGFSIRSDGSDDPLALADVTILVPTRRAVRSLRAALQDRLGGRSAILPRIATIGDVDEDAGLIDGSAVPAFARDLTHEVNGIERLLGLTRLVIAWTESVGRTLVNPVTGAAPTVPTSPAEAAHLARALLTLLDQVETEGAEWSRLAEIVPADHAAYWALTLGFLQIVTDHWPRFLDERGLVDPARHRNEAIRREAARLRARPPTGPVVAAGSTGSIPATAELLDVVSRLPRGAVVLPGLDRTLDDETWAAIETDRAVGHPQYGLKRLVESGLRTRREGVSGLGPPVGPALDLRQRVLGEALKPPSRTESWRDFAARHGGAVAIGQAFAGVGLIEARSEAEEAVAIALAMRETLERDHATAALVTPDRKLARRVAVELGRWGIAVDDSAGIPLGRTPPAVLARLVAEVATGGFDPVPLVSLLRHPLAGFGLERAAARATGRILEIAALRGPRPRPGLAGLVEAFYLARHEADTGLGGRDPHRARLTPADWQAAEDLLDRLRERLGPLEALASAPGLVPFGRLLQAHVTALRAVAADETGSDAALFGEEAGEALAELLAGLVEAARSPDLEIGLRGIDLPGFLTAIIGHQPVRRRLSGSGERLHIWGPLEARLQSVDRLILAGLNEGIWPQTTRSDPWLSRPMKAELDLEPPERRIGLAAHDFAQGAAAPEVILSRALRSGGNPTVASRWIQRLLAVVGEGPAKAMRDRGDRHVRRARALDRAPKRPRPIGRPSPAPPVELRPTSLSVTEIETWFRDPYAVYARHILKLAPMEGLATELDGADRGSLVHAVLARFAAGWSAETPEASRARFETEIDRELEAFAAFPEVVALWRPRLLRIGAWFVEHFEVPRAPDVAHRLVEQKAVLSVLVDGVGFDLVGRADRIDLMTDGSVAVMDYKTGSVPSLKQIRALLAPQLPLEAAMVVAGAFGPDLVERPISELKYVKLSGSGEGGEVCEVTAPPTRTAPPVSAEDLAEAVLAKLRGLIATFRNPKQGYPSRPRIQFSRQTGGTYDHLARVKEWAAGEEGDAE